MAKHLSSKVGFEGRAI